MAPYPLERPLPAELNAKAARDAYLAENGFDLEQYDADSVRINFWGFRFSLPNPAARKLAIRYHDLHHVMTGYGTDPTGEAEISAWEYRRGIKVFGWYVQLIILTGVAFGFLHSPRKVRAAWKASKSGSRLPKPSLEHYETLLGMTVGQLREAYGVPAEGLAGRRKLNRDAPKPA